MYINKLHLTNFRNYEQVDLTLERGLNLFVGENAQGKSNLLEAIYLLSTLRSSRASSDTDLVRRGALDSEFPRRAPPDRGPARRWPPQPGGCRRRSRW